MNACLSYNATLATVGEVSKLYRIPLQQWIDQGITFKFVGDNLDKMKKVRDLRVDNQSELQHMCSLIAVRSRVPYVPSPDTRRGFASLTPSAFLLTEEDVKAIKSNLVVLVSHILCLPARINHAYSKEMAQKSEVVVLDVLMKNEVKGSDMLEIMQTMQAYLGKDYPATKRVLSGGDQVTCERQVGAKRHVMDSDTPSDRLDVFEVQTEDWHALMSFLGVSAYIIVHSYIYIIKKLIMTKDACMYT